MASSPARSCWEMVHKAPNASWQSELSGISAELALPRSSWRGPSSPRRRREEGHSTLDAEVKESPRRSHQPEWGEVSASSKKISLGRSAVSTELQATPATSSALESRMKLLEAQGARSDRRVAELAGLAQALSEEQRVLLIRVDKLEENRGGLAQQQGEQLTETSEDHARRLARLEREQRTVAVNLRLVVSVAEEAQQRQQQRLRALQESFENRLCMLEESSQLPTGFRNGLRDSQKSESPERVGIASELRGLGITSSLGVADKRLEEVQTALRQCGSSVHTNEVSELAPGGIGHQHQIEELQSKLSDLLARTSATEERILGLRDGFDEVKTSINQTRLQANLDALEERVVKVAEQHMAALRAEVAEARDAADAAITLRTSSAEADTTRVESLNMQLQKVQHLAETALSKTKAVEDTQVSQMADIETKLSQVKIVAEEAYARSQYEEESSDLADIRAKLSEAYRMAEMALAKLEDAQDSEPHRREAEAPAMTDIGSACSGDLAAGGSADFEARIEALHMQLAPGDEPKRSTAMQGKKCRKGRRSWTEDAISEYRAQAHAIDADLEVRLSKLNDREIEEVKVRPSSKESVVSEDDLRSFCVQLEADLGADIKEAHRRCDTIQEVVGQQIMVSVWRLEQQLPEALSKVDRLLGECSDRFSKVEEHDVRLNYTLGKLGNCEQRLQTCVERLERLPSNQQVKMICREESSKVSAESDLAGMVRRIDLQDRTLEELGTQLQVCHNSINLLESQSTGFSTQA
mmetsp:Transcript_9519/g.21252  ORF Transcript_9519/g.21252 Transcript_9519/m.21252 type:complete len:756 (-) Transcript_9519:75-2342(-)